MPREESAGVEAGPPSRIQAGFGVLGGSGSTPTAYSAAISRIAGWALFTGPHFSTKSRVKVGASVGGCRTLPPTEAAPQRVALQRRNRHPSLEGGRPLPPRAALSGTWSPQRQRSSDPRPQCALWLCERCSSRQAAKGAKIPRRLAGTGLRQGYGRQAPRPPKYPFTCAWLGIVGGREQR